MKRGWFDFAEGQLLLSVLCGLLFFLVVMAGEFLHYVSGGAIPQFIEWHPVQKRPVNPKQLIKYVGEEKEPDLRKNSRQHRNRNEFWEDIEIKEQID